jgi:HD superfamily phosphodiesterase
MTEKFYAHSGRRRHSGGQPDWSDGQPLREHLTEVAKLARRLAEQASPADMRLAEAAEAAGLYHDLVRPRRQ